jgi:hypothetical protein
VREREPLGLGVVQARELGLGRRSGGAGDDESGGRESRRNDRATEVR